MLVCCSHTSLAVCTHLAVVILKQRTALATPCPRVDLCPQVPCHPHIARRLPVHGAISSPSAYKARGLHIPGRRHPQVTRRPHVALSTQVPRRPHVTRCLRTHRRPLLACCPLLGCICTYLAVHPQVARHMHARLT